MANQNKLRVFSFKIKRQAKNVFLNDVERTVGYITFGGSSIIVLVCESDVSYVVLVLPFLFLISAFFGASGELCFVIVTIWICLSYTMVRAHVRAIMHERELVHYRTYMRRTMV